MLYENIITHLYIVTPLVSEMYVFTHVTHQVLIMNPQIFLKELTSYKTTIKKITRPVISECLHLISLK